MTATHYIDTRINGRDVGRFIAWLAILGLCRCRHSLPADRVEVWMPRPWLVDGTHEVSAYERYVFPSEWLKGDDDG